jgi:hypothetical protein
VNSKLSDYEKFQRALGFLLFLLLFNTATLAAQRVEERDRDGDGRKETRVYFENDRTVKMVMDQNGDNKADGTIFFKNGFPATGETDSDFNGKIDTWVEYEAGGLPVVIGRDRRVDGKPDYWIFLRDGSIYKREWDRNFDGLADFRTLEKEHKLIEKHYDDNFDGKFEKTIKPLPKGATGRIKTTAGPELVKP